MELSPDEASWIASLSNIGQLFGAIATGVLSGKYGRRPTLMLLCLPLLAGWSVLALAGQFGHTVWLFYTGRVLQGIGVMSSVTQVYLVEVADTDRRGLFGASGALSVSVGITLVYCLGALCHWQVVCVICAMFPIATFIAMIFLPETPPWLILNGKKEEAEKVLKWLRGEVYDISKEIESMSASSGGSSKSSSIAETLATFQYPAAYKPFLILLFVFIFQQLSGSYAVIFYAVNVFSDIGVSTNPYIPTIITGIIRIAGTLIGTALVKKYGRKPLMTISAVLMGLFMTSLAVTVHFKEQFYNQHCLPIKQNSSLPQHCYVNSTSSFLEAPSEYVETLRLAFDVWPALSVILYILGKKILLICIKILNKLHCQCLELVWAQFLGSFLVNCVLARSRVWPLGSQSPLPLSASLLWSNYSHLGFSI